MIEKGQFTPTERGWALQDRASTVPHRLARALAIPGDELVALRDVLRRITDSALDHTVGMEN